jgi:hypothetical protein
MLIRPIHCSGGGITQAVRTRTPTRELRMNPLFTAFLFAIAMLMIAPGAQAAVPDPGPPYTEAQFLAISQERLPYELRNNLPKWWGQAPDYLKKHILNTDSQRWPSIIMCNYFGFRPDQQGALNSAKCEEEHFQASQRGKKNWTADGQWVGPSEECIKRNKRSKYGELLCD